MQTKITIPESHYVGMVKRGNESSMPLGFMTPWGVDDAAKKRIATIDNWARRDALPSTVITNTPMLGFKMTASIRRGDYGAADKWRIADPRGFEVEITSNNLAQLLSITTIEKGEILDKCVWARDGGVNILLSVESDAYIAAVNLTVIAHATALWKDVKIGNNVVLQNGLKGRYLGRMHALAAADYNRSVKVSNMIADKSKLFYTILVDGDSRLRPKTFVSELYFIANPKLSSSTAGNELTIAEAEILVNASIVDPTCYTTCGNETALIASASPIKPNMWNLSLVETELPHDTFNREYYSRKDIVRLPDNRIGYLIRREHSTLMISIINESRLSTGVLAYDTHTTRVSTWTITTAAVDINDIKKLYYMCIEIVTPSGNTIRNKI